MTRVMDMQQYDIEQLEKLYITLGKEGKHRRTTQRLKLYDLHRMDLWKKIRVSHAQLLEADPPPPKEYEEKYKKAEEINRKMMEKLNDWGHPAGMSDDVPAEARAAFATEMASPGAMQQAGPSTRVVGVWNDPLVALTPLPQAKERAFFESGSPCHNGKQKVSQQSPATVPVGQQLGNVSNVDEQRGNADMSAKFEEGQQVNTSMVQHVNNNNEQRVDVHMSAKIEERQQVNTSMVQHVNNNNEQRVDVHMSAQFDECQRAINNAEDISGKSPTRMMNAANDNTDISCLAKMITSLATMQARQLEQFDPAIIQARKESEKKSATSVGRPRELNIPTFKGDVLQYPFFKDAVHRVMDNSGWDDIDKFIYGRDLTAGRARELISQLQVDGSSWENMWIILDSNFNRPRRREAATVQMILNEEFRIRENDHTTIRQFRDTFENARANFQTLEMDWRKIIVIQTIRRMDSETVRRLEDFLEDTTVTPSIEEISRFLLKEEDLLTVLDGRKSSNHHGIYKHPKKQY
jgi:hypothetical protein